MRVSRAGEVHVRAWAGLLFAATGCFSADEEHFPESYATVYCLRVEECARGVYESNYDGEMEQCVGDIQDIAEELAKASDTFDDGEAVDCLDGLRSETCGDWAEGEPNDCAGVYAVTMQNFFGDL